MPCARNSGAPLPSAIFFASASNTSMNRRPIVLRFCSGSVTPSSSPRKASRVHVDERDVVMVAEQAHDLLGLGLAHQAVIDEDAGQLVADRLVDQHGGDGGSTPPDRPQITRPLPT